MYVTKEELILATGADLVGFGADGAVRTVGSKLSDLTSVLDFIPAELHAAIKARTSTIDVGAYFQAATVAANGGLVAGDSPGGRVFVPQGTYCLDKVGIRDTVFIGEGGGTIIKALSPGTAGEFMFDAKLDRDGVTGNAHGQGWCVDMTIDANHTGRSCLQTYGGGIDASGLTLLNGAYGLAVGLPIWSIFNNIHAQSCNVGFYTFHNESGDNGTSTIFASCWADSCVTYGFHISQLFYSSFHNCVAQNSGAHNFFVEGDLNGVPACYSLQFSGCATEGSGTPFYFKKVRDLTVIGPRIISPDNAHDFIVLDDAQGSVRDFSTVANPGSGKFHLSVLNHQSGPGSILVDNCIASYDSANDPFFSIIGGSTNNQQRSQSYQSRWNAATAAERMTAEIGNVDGWAGLNFHADDGTRVAVFRRIGTPIFATNGDINAPGTNLNPGDVSFAVNGEQLKFVTKTASGDIKTFTLTSD